MTQSLGFQQKSKKFLFQEEFGEEIFDGPEEFDYDIFNEPVPIKQCSEYEAVGYHCVPYYSCDECNVIITDGGDLFDACKTSRKY